MAGALKDILLFFFKVYLMVIIKNGEQYLQSYVSCKLTSRYKQITVCENVQARQYTESIIVDPLKSTLSMEMPPD